MKKVLVIASMLPVWALALSAASWTGYISDSKCGAKGNSEAHAQCAQGCVKAGAEPVLVVDGKVFKIANPDKVKDHAGEKLTITGDASGDTITVTNVASAE